MGPCQLPDKQSQYGVDSPSIPSHPSQGPGPPTELLQGVHGVLHVDPEAQPPQ